MFGLNPVTPGEQVFKQRADGYAIVFDGRVELSFDPFGIGLTNAPKEDGCAFDGGAGLIGGLQDDADLGGFEIHVGGDRVESPVGVWG